ncbi:MAG TPA: hypothetical protein VGL15_08315, partial [Vicinamibacteria bacterium]
VLVVAFLLTATACASASHRRSVPVDLAPARAALETARQAGAPEKAAGTFEQAEVHLKQAEREGGSAEARDDALKAEWLARIATVEARCTASTPSAPRAADRATESGEVERVTERLRRSDEQRRRQDERIALLQHELEVTEIEMIRTKARLKGLETKAEASSAIAEARILMSRLDPRTRSVSLSRAEQALVKAEQLLQEENFGAALFFAMKAQDIAKAAP